MMEETRATGANETPTETTWWPEEGETPSNVDPVLARFWEVVRRAPSYLKLALGLARDGRVPPAAKGILAAGGIYSLSPIDLVPGLIPVAGQLDDMVVLLIAIRQALRLSPPEVADDYLRRYQITVETIDADLAATRDLAIWLVGRGARFVGRAAVRGGRALWRRVGSARSR